VLKTTSGALLVLGPLDSATELTAIDNGRGEGAAPRYSRCGRFIVDASWSGHLVVLDATAGECIDHREFPSDRIVELALSATGDKWFAHHSPRAATDRPPDPDYFSVWSLPLPESPHRILRPDFRFVHDSALSGSGELLALHHGAPPVNLSIVNVSTGEIACESKIEVGGTGGRMAWASSGELAVVERHRVRIYSAELAVLGEYELNYACDVAFSPRGDLVAIGSWESGRLLSTSDILR
jgi:hypothetical protein